jgi:hypothetical protein
MIYALEKNHLPNANHVLSTHYSSYRFHCSDIDYENRNIEKVDHWPSQISIFEVLLLSFFRVHDIRLGLLKEE